MSDPVGKKDKLWRDEGEKCACCQRELARDDYSVVRLRIISTVVDQVSPWGFFCFRCSEWLKSHFSIAARVTQL